MSDWHKRKIIVKIKCEYVIEEKMHLFPAISATITYRILATALKAVNISLLAMQNQIWNINITKYLFIYYLKLLDKL